MVLEDFDMEEDSLPDLELSYLPIELINTSTCPPVIIANDRQLHNFVGFVQKCASTRLCVTSKAKVENLNFEAQHDFREREWRRGREKRRVVERRREGERRREAERWREAETSGERRRDGEKRRDGERSGETERDGEKRRDGEVEREALKSPLRLSREKEIQRKVLEQEGEKNKLYD
uniref:Uncharacterized protein n=1 Tax=Brassica oleracea var. oleracea TaxID=109376 RepID=A0A0D3C1J5_BRAOL